jgi:hypothetical protein
MLRPLDRHATGLLRALILALLLASGLTERFLGGASRPRCVAAPVVEAVQKARPRSSISKDARRSVPNRWNRRAAIRSAK